MKSSLTLPHQPRLGEFGRQILRPEELEVGMHVGQIAVGANRSGRVLSALAVLLDGSGMPGESRRDAARRLWQPQHLPQWRGQVEHIAEDGMRVDLTVHLPYPDSSEYQDHNYWNLSPAELPDVSGPTYTQDSWADLGLAPIPRNMVGGMTGWHGLSSEDIGRWFPRVLVELPAPHQQQ